MAGNLRAESEKGVDKRGGGRAGEDDQETQKHQNEEDWQEPPLFVELQEAPELSEKGTASFIGRGLLEVVGGWHEILDKINTGESNDWRAEQEDEPASSSRRPA